MISRTPTRRLQNSASSVSDSIFSTRRLKIWSEELLAPRELESTRRSGFWKSVWVKLYTSLQVPLIVTDQLITGFSEERIHKLRGEASFTLQTFNFLTPDFSVFCLQNWHKLTFLNQTTELLLTQVESYWALIQLFIPFLILIPQTVQIWFTAKYLDPFPPASNKHRLWSECFLEPLDASISKREHLLQQKCIKWQKNGLPDQKSWRPNKGWWKSDVRGKQTVQCERREKRCHMKMFSLWLSDTQQRSHR